MSRKGTRAGHYTRKLGTTSGTVELQVPKLRTLKFETAIIELYKRRESSVEEALIEMYLAGVSVRRVGDITEALWGEKVSLSTLSNLNQKVYGRLEEWRNRPIEGAHPYVYLDGISLKRSWGGEVKNVSVLAAIRVNAEGFREILGVAEGCKEDKAGWLSFLKHLKERGLKGVRRRVKVIGAFSDGESALMLCAARLRHVASKNWGQRLYMDMTLLEKYAGSADGLRAECAGEREGLSSTVAG